jgi:ATP-dependent DNA helicase RecQ
MDNNLLIITAPPAFGKTFLIEKLTDQMDHRPLVIAPLRALADECRHKWKDSVLVMTPEEWLGKKSKSRTVIFDEFHLHYYWGDTFRPLMWEVFYELAAEAELVILLTATLNSSMVDEVKLYGIHFDRMIWCDFGNQTLKNRPYRYFHLSSMNWIKSLIFSLRWKGTSLIFCAYRHEVLWWEQALLGEGYTVWSCVGGEAAAFSQKVSREPPPDFIVATTVLSHGVNLPSIGRIFFTYQVKNLDFWIQMVARGGRRGEKFDVYALERPAGLKWNYFNNYLAIGWLSLRIKTNNILIQLQSWFLKD